MGVVSRILPVIYADYSDVFYPRAFVDFEKFPEAMRRFTPKQLLLKFHKKAGTYFWDVNNAYNFSGMGDIARMLPNGEILEIGNYVYDEGGILCRVNISDREANLLRMKNVVTKLESALCEIDDLCSRIKTLPTGRSYLELPNGVLNISKS